MINTADAVVRERYEHALDLLVASLKPDRTILAAVLCGSLAYDQVWDKSDIDLVLIGDETYKGTRGVCLTETGVNVHASIIPRSAFKKTVEGTLHGSFMHSLLSRGRLLYTHDESLTDLLADLQTIGARDKEWQLLRVASGIPPILAKAEKWFYVRRDYRYTALWLLAAAGELARIEVLTHGQNPGREVIQQALKLNPALFHSLYTDLIDAPKDAAHVGAVLDTVNAYLDERIDFLFGPLLRFLADAGGPRSMTEISDHFRKHVQETPLDAACEWLADKNIVEKVGMPLRLSEKSRVTVNEAAYYYDGPSV